MIDVIPFLLLLHFQNNKTKVVKWLLKNIVTSFILPILITFAFVVTKYTKQHYGMCRYNVKILLV